MIRTLVRLACLASILIGTGQAVAHEYQLGALRIDHPHTSASHPGAMTAAGYASFVNEGTTDVLLKGARSDAAARVEIHESKVEDGIARMTHVTQGVVIPAGTAVVFAPRSYHLMLFDLTKPFAEGDRVKVVLDFEGGDNIEIELVVHARAIGDHHH